MDRWVGKVAIITGASSGIGAAIAESLVAEGLSVVGLARRVERVEKLASTLKSSKGGRLYAVKCDVGEERDIVEAFDWVEDKFGGVDVLVNNAGVSKNKRIIDDDIDSFRNILNVNLLATAIAVRKAVDSMIRRNVSGHIVNINSILGHPISGFPMPVSIYASSKYGVTALTENVRKELAAANSKIKITSISPGVVATEIFESSGVEKVEELFEATPHLVANDIADAVVHVLGTPENVLISELTIRHVGETV